MSDLSKRSEDALRARSEVLRRRRLSGRSALDLLPEALNVCGEAIRRTAGVAPAEDEVEAARAMCLGLVAQLSAGGGRNGALTMAAYWHGLDGAGVHVMSLTDALAEWHMTEMRTPLRLLGFDVGVVTGESTDVQRRAAYAADVTCGSHLQLAADHLCGDLYDDVADATQRGTQVLIVDDVDALLVEHANVPSMVTAPRPPGADRDAERAAVRLRVGEHYLVRAGAVCFTLSGSAVLKRAVGWGARPRIASACLAYRVESIIRGREGLRHGPDRMVLASVTVREHARRYRVVCGLTQVASPAEELERGYGLRLRPIAPATPPHVRQHPGLVYATDPDRLTDLTRRVAAASEVGRPVLVAAPFPSAAAEVAIAFDQARMNHHHARAGDEVTVLNLAARRGAVTVIDLHTFWPPPIRLGADLTETAERDELAGWGGLAVFGLALGSSRRQMDRLRAIAGGVPSEIWPLLSVQDRALAGVYSGLARWAQRHDPSPVVLDGRTLVARLIGRQLQRVQAAGDAAGTEERMQGWAYASVVQGQRDELLRTRRAVLLSGDAAGLVERMIDDIVADWVATGSAQELAARMADLVPARLLDEGEPVGGTEQTRMELRRAYRKRENELGPAVMRNLERKVLITVIDMCWRDQLEALSFLARHARELHNRGPTLTRYRIDADHLGHELTRRLRYDSLQYMFKLIVEPPPVGSDTSAAP
ncbi:MAG TPA: hypothetical protein VFY84_08490 [Jiangellales bacterium]|nr:hypothetical protein [Jiangellales bacterium]